MFIEEELTIAEFADKLLNETEFSIPKVINIRNLGIEILTFNIDRRIEQWKRIDEFIVKEKVNKCCILKNNNDSLKCTINHRIFDKKENKWLVADSVSNSEILNEEMYVVDFSVAGNKNYIANGFINHNTTPGGMATPFFSDVQIRLYTSGKIKAGEDIIGVGTRAKVMKTRFGPPFREAQLKIYFDKGLIDEDGWFDHLKAKKLIEKIDSQKSKLTIEEEVIEFKNREFIKLLRERPELKNKIKKMIKQDLYVEQDPEKREEEIEIKELEVDEVGNI